MEDRERKRPLATDDEKGTDEDVELHKKRLVQSNEEAPSEGDSDDDVELHKKRLVQ